MKRLIAISALAVLCLPAQENVDLSVVNRIKSEALEHSQVMDHLFQFTDVIGPRVADSPAYLKAGEWAVTTMKGWGLQDARLEKWGEFGRSWSYSRGVVQMVEPQQTTLIAVPQAWSPSTNGVVSGEVILAPMRKVEDGEKYKGKLKGKIVLIDAERDLWFHMEPDARRYTDAALADMAKAPEPERRREDAVRRWREAEQARDKLIQFLVDEGALAVLSAGYAGDDGTLFTSPAGSRDRKSPIPPVAMVVAAEQYNRIVRLVKKNIPVKLELDVKTQLHEQPGDGVNVVAEIPGGSKKDEVVMIGAHLDSWQAGTGATDDAAGCAVMMEAVRILKALDLKMDRTVRIALWDAEEEGLLGSRGYVTNHFADRETMSLKPEHAKLAGYFNFDYGAGKIRGVYLQNNDMMRPVFQAWLAPFADMGASTISIRNAGGTDHLSFDAVGLPGFQFIQDPLDYMARTHHTNMDVYERVPAPDMMQASAIVASFVYNAATRPEMLPRKPLPKPEPKPEAAKTEAKKN